MLLTSIAGGISHARTEPRPPAYPSEERRTVKRTIRIVAGVVTLSAAVCLGVQLWAQGTTTQAQPAATRGSKVGVINLAQVINSYEKWTAFKAEYKKEYDRVFEQRVAKDKLNYESLKKEFEDAKTLPERKEVIQREIKKVEFQIQTIADEAKQILGKKEADEFVQLYREVRDAVKACATYYNIDVVMHYNDAFEEKDLDTPQNVARKMGQACCMPLYVNPECDLSKVVIGYLNKYYKPASAITPASGTTGGGTTSGTTGGATTGNQGHQ
jgi:Skp family chaperone for outer membrane proteins